MLFTMTIILGGAVIMGGKVYQNKKRKKIPLVQILSSNISSKRQINGFPKLLAPLTSSQRQQQMRAIMRENGASDEEKETTQLLVLQSANIGIALLSLFYSPLLLLTLPGSIYSLIPAYKLSYENIKKGRFSSYILDTILGTGVILSGYLFTAVIGLWMFTAGRYLLIKSENHSKQNLSNLFGELPRTVWVLVNGAEIEIPFEQLQPGDILMVRAGQMIAVDGIITKGLASIDQHKLTGESQPVEKGVGDTVLCSTIVLAGQIHIQTEKTGQETVAMQIGHILELTADFQNALQSRGEVIADQLAMPTLGLSILALSTLGVSSALAVLTNTFGYKMRIFSPSSMLTFLNIASQQGILIKDGRSLDYLCKIDTVVFDKTGTLTLEIPTVAAIHTTGRITESELLQYAAAAEYGQSHPIAKAILQAADQCGLSWPQIENAEYKIGYGIQVTLPDQVIHVGSHKFMLLEGIAIHPDIKHIQEQCGRNGYSLVMVALNKTMVGAIELQASIRPEAKQIVDDLRQRKISIYVISGDHEQPTRALAATLGIEHYFANTLPENKASLIEGLQEQGKTVCFIGDGINDTIALKKANVSISLRGATTVAQDTAQIVMMDGSLVQLTQLLNLGQNFEKNMQTNFVISTVPSVISILGITFFHWGVLLGILLTGMTLFIGIGNSLLPLLTHENSKGNH